MLDEQTEMRDKAEKELAETEIDKVEKKLDEKRD